MKMKKKKMKKLITQKVRLMNKKLSHKSNNKKHKNHLNNNNKRAQLKVLSQVMIQQKMQVRVRKRQQGDKMIVAQRMHLQRNQVAHKRQMMKLQLKGAQKKLVQIPLKTLLTMVKYKVQKKKQQLENY